MNGFYSIWTKPFYINKDINEDYFMSEYDLLTFILSVCVWQKNNGPAAVYVDDKAREYLERLNITGIFERGIFDLEVSEKINPKVFWAAGKLFALAKEKEPSVMIDMDLIIWKNLDDFFQNADVYGIHREYIRPEIYPSFDFFKLKNHEKYFDKMSEQVDPLNTAMLYISDDELKNEYLKQAIYFMENVDENHENLKHMVFAEQRLLPVLAAIQNKSIKTMFSHGEDIGYQEYFTHVWGHKNILKYNHEEKNKFCKRILNRLKNEYSDVYNIVSKIQDVKEYIDE